MGVELDCRLEAIATSNKKLLETKGIATTRSKDATSSFWPYYYIVTISY